MKRWMSLLLALVLALGLAACGRGEEAVEPEGEEEELVEAQPAHLRVAGLKGPTGMGLVQLMQQSEAGNTGSNTYEFSLVGAPDEVVSGLGSGKLDIACVAANLGATLYNNTDGAVQVIAMNVLGVLYIVENGGSVASVQDLEGKTIYCAGKGSTPEYALQHILDSYGVSAAIEWKSEHAECVAAVMADPSGVAMLPQPFATAAQLQNQQIRVALDLNELWEELGDGSALVTGCVVARREVVEGNPAAIDLFLEQYAASVDYVNANIPEAAALIEKYDIIKAAVAEKAIPRCNIVCVTGEEMQSKLGAYLTLLHMQDPKAVGGTLPLDDFYYVGR